MSYCSMTIDKLKTGNMFRLPNDTAVYIRTQDCVVQQAGKVQVRNLEANSVSLVNGELFNIPKDQQIYKITRDQLRDHIFIQTMVCDVPMGARFTKDGDGGKDVFIRCQGTASLGMLMCFNTAYSKNWPLHPNEEVTLCQ